MSKGAQNVAAVIALVIVFVLIRERMGDGPDPAPTPVKPGQLGAVVSPVPSARVSSGFGARWGASHNGLDFAAPMGTPIRAIAAGQVIVARPASGFGLWMQVRHGDGTVSVYGHMQRMTKPVGARVRAGEQIATVGSRGQSTGPHLHLEVWPGGDRSRATDPAKWFRARKAPLTAGAAR